MQSSFFKGAKVTEYTSPNGNRFVSDDGIVFRDADYVAPKVFVLNAQSDEQEEAANGIDSVEFAFHSENQVSVTFYNRRGLESGVDMDAVWARGQYARYLALGFRKVS